MSLLEKLKSVLGLGTSTQRATGQRDVGVTVEHEPGDSDARVEAANAVKGVDVTDETESRTEPETHPEPDVSDQQAETEGEPGDRGSVEIPDAEELGPDDESDEDQADEAPVEIPDAEELARDGKAEPDTEDEAAEGESGTEMAEPEPDAAEEPVDTIKGIGSTYAERLAEADIETVGDLAAADPADVAGDADVSESRLQRWVQRARER